MPKHVLRSTVSEVGVVVNLTCSWSGDSSSSVPLSSDVIRRELILNRFIVLILVGTPSFS